MTNRTLRLTALIGLAVSIGNAQDRGAQMDAYVQGLADTGRFQGAVLVAQNGATLLDKGYGPANAEFDISNTSSTKFRLGSITKQFTAMGGLTIAGPRQVARGRSGLPVPAVVPGRV